MSSAEQEKKNRDELFRLMQKHPELPVVPMVDSEIVADDGYAWWLGHWGRAKVDGYIITDERVLVRSYDDDEEDVLSEVLGWEAYEELTDEEAAQAYKDLKWTEAIMVFITT